MSGQEITSIFFTFITGIFFGVFMFFSGFMSDSAPAVQTQQQANDFRLIAEAYGGCQMVQPSSCPSFQILSDGSFRYFYTQSAGADQVLREGTLPRALRTEINTSFNTLSLQAQSKETQPAFCESFRDGIDVSYRVTLAGEQYELDTCGTTIDTSSSLWLTLVKIWNYFETGDV